MGGRSSKVEAYVLRCVNEDNESAVRSTSKKSKKIDEAKTNIMDNVQSPRQNLQSPRVTSIGGRDSPPGNAGSLLKQQGTSSRKLNRSISQIAQDTNSSPNRTRGIVYSSRHPWLLKNCSGINHISQIEMERVIGTGLMGTVRLAKLKDKGYIAMKGIRKDYIVKHRGQEHAENERKVMLLLSSPFCIKLFGTFQDGPNIYFAMELAVGGELFNRLAGGVGRYGLQAQECKFYLSEIFCALEHIQDCGYAYRDLKPENVMLDEDGHCKLVDFGFASKPDENGILKTLCGTPAYISPEQLNGKFTNGYSKVCDWWSLGIILYELMTSKTPFCKNDSETSYEIYLRILKTKMSFPRSWKDSQAKELVQALCHGSMDKRLIDPKVIKINPYFTIPWESVLGLKMVPPFVPKIKGEAHRDHYFRKLSDRSIDPADTHGRLDLEGF